MAAELFTRQQTGAGSVQRKPTAAHRTSSRVALVLGLALFLALLGSWFARIHKEDAAPTETVNPPAN